MDQIRDIFLDWLRDAQTATKQAIVKQHVAMLGREAIRLGIDRPAKPDQVSH